MALSDLLEHMGRVFGNVTTKMTLNSFLASLPALLGITGFVVYQLLRSNLAGDPIIQEILKKLRQQNPDAAARYDKLKGRALENQLKHDQALQNLISQQDFVLLQQTLRHRFIISLVVYGITTLLFLVGVFLFYRTVMTPKRLVLGDWTIQSVEPGAGGRAVDLDELVIGWKADGEPEDVIIYLENVQTSRRSIEMKTSSHQQKITISPRSYSACLADRNLRGRNRIRVVCQTSKETFKSKESDLLVGIQVLAFHDAEKNAVRIAAMIDQSAIQFYQFEAKAIVWTSGKPPQILEYGGKSIASVGTFPVEQQEGIRWDTLKVHYFGPDEPFIVRTKNGLD